MKRRHPMTWLVVWLAVALLATLFALVWVVSQRDVAETQLNRAHWAGMELGQHMRLGFRSEMERGPLPAAATAQPQRGGLL
ncbi:MAG: hypothetical protein K2X78_02315 [Burkholderiaceae bacterium]|nr:hypothetical protein [Burkholderiaceae bacterium]